MADFKPFAKLVHDRFIEMSKHELFVVDISGDLMWDHYLNAFPAGTNPIYRERTEHDCSCCKNFIRNLGNVVAIVDGKLQSVWDTAAKKAEEPYRCVAQELSNHVLSQTIVGLFRTKESHYGAESNKELLDNGNVKIWNHFHGEIQAKHQTNDVGSVVGNYATAAQVFERGLNELSAEAVQQVIDLIDAKALYRGEEHLNALKHFRDAQKLYAKQTSETNRNILVWVNAGAAVARFRNTVIGTLVQDITAGMDLEAAVRSFETKVAPTNYKRTTALITPKMIQEAMKMINHMGIESALERRFAKISDVSVNNVLWVNNETKAHMKNPLEQALLQATKTPAMKETATGKIIGIDDFMKNILPTAKSLELLLSNDHMNNFMSLTAPVHENSGTLFKWDNDFGWSYDGNITDSIKERVKNAGGNVSNAVMRFSLAWFNFDDLDIHVQTPSHRVIYYGNKWVESGNLDVDMNAGSGKTRTPVENVSWTAISNGVYKIFVDQFHRRETTDIGCVIEIENNGKITQLSYPKALGKHTPFAEVEVSRGKIINIKPAKGVIGGGISQEKWGVKTEAFTKVNTVMFSPNYWDENAVGNKHHFFILDGCINPEATRGIYNEFLHSKFEQYRKVFEVLGDKTKCPSVPEQLSGVGFSSTRHDKVTVRIQTERGQSIYEVQF